MDFRLGRREGGARGNLIDWDRDSPKTRKSTEGEKLNMLEAEGCVDAVWSLN